MKNIFVLIGKTGSGKTTVCETLEEKFGIERVKSFTTRSPRTGEINGKDYYFYDFASVIIMISRGEAIALRCYTPHISFGPYPWYYGFNKRDIEKAENPLLISDLPGLESIKEEFPEYNVVSIYLDIAPNIQKKRLSDRGPEMEQENERRILADEVDFAEALNITDHIIDGKKNKNTVAKEIKGIIENS